MDGCKKTAIVFDTVVANVELINCTSCKIQVRELTQSINVDKCDGVQIILNRASLNAEILSAKCSELNIVVPGENEGDEFTEHAIPEQFTSVGRKGTGDRLDGAHRLEIRARSKHRRIIMAKQLCGWSSKGVGMYRGERVVRGDASRG